ncbi:DUF445 domain-containing protein [Fusibacter sp. JL298sf-3]
MLIKLVLMATIGAFIGWTTNVIAIKLLFRPIHPVKVPLLPFYIQGLMPKRKAEIAKSIGETVEKELISVEEIMDELIESVDKTQVIEQMQVYIVEIVKEKMPAMVPSMFRGMILNYVHDIIASEGERLINELSEKVIHHATDKIDMAQMIEDKINAFPMEELEALVIRIAQKELKHIEYLGGLIGFFIGVLQWVLVLLI